MVEREDTIYVELLLGQLLWCEDQGLVRNAVGKTNDHRIRATQDQRSEHTLGTKQITR